MLGVEALERGAQGFGEEAARVGGEQGGDAGVVADGARDDAVGAAGEWFEAGGDVDVGAEVVEAAVEGDGGRGLAGL